MQALLLVTAPAERQAGCQLVVLPRQFVKGRDGGGWNEGAPYGGAGHRVAAVAGSRSSRRRPGSPAIRQPGSDPCVLPASHPSSQLAASLSQPCCAATGDTVTTPLQTCRCSSSKSVSTPASAQSSGRGPVRALPCREATRRCGSLPLDPHSGGSGPLKLLLFRRLQATAAGRAAGRAAKGQTGWMGQQRGRPGASNRSRRRGQQRSGRQADSTARADTPYAAAGRQLSGQPPARTITHRMSREGSARSAGRVPLIRLYPSASRDSCGSALGSLHSSGKVPVSWLLARTRFSRRGIAPSAPYCHGSEPDSRFCCGGWEVGQGGRGAVWADTQEGERRSAALYTADDAAQRG